MASAPSTREIPAELKARLPEIRRQIEQELPDLMERDRHMQEAAAEQTLSGHLRRAIHHSHRSLDDIAADAGIPVLHLCDFLEGERTLRSDVLDRLGHSVGAVFPESANTQRGQ
ncbi:MAG TPA: hypothetical protein VK137_15065 [Planctomycetaceae bacterium]|nr:hypothetical protein [Planctomycetaceae bacterium]